MGKSVHNEINKKWIKPDWKRTYYFTVLWKKDKDQLMQDQVI